mmetsp:Transcript_10368/g.21608  ORF Transcript_10368/g.21608 Transcript_10368/m.21608 type:complete len:165 (+) Transcript_10368:122-616(+)
MWPTRQPNATDRMKEMVGLEVEEQNLLDEIDDFATCSKTTRLYGFLTTVSLGTFLSVMSTFFIINPRIFSVLYTAGNIVALSSTAFLVGPMSQLRNMFSPHRAAATIVYILLMGTTLYSALVLHKTGLTLISVSFQSLALAWYCLSYIPYGRRIVKTLCGLMFS